MKLTLTEMKEVARRLPVGYYLGAKVPVVVEEGQSAYADMVKREIHIGIGLLQSAADAIAPADAAKWDREKLLRCLLYHEIGHLLLTGKGLMNIKLKTPKGGIFRNSHDFVNIFEDERIETLLQGKFLDADFAAFKRLAIRPIAKPNTPAEKMLMAVRLRRTTPQISALIDTTIQELAHYTRSDYSVYVYQLRLQAVVDAILRNEPPQEQKQEQKQKQEQGQEQEQEQEQEQGREQKQSQGQEQEQGQEQGQGHEQGQGQGQEQEQEQNKSAQVCVPGGRNPSDSDLDLRGLWQKEAFAPSEATAAALNRFACRLAKKRGAQSAGMWSALHGRISPKRDAMDKDRIFRRVSDVGANINQSVNLVLWVDVSGSFSSSEETLNKILASVADAERMSAGKLRVQVVHMGEEAHVAKPGAWQIRANQNNSITPSFEKAWANTRDKTRRNIDIVVFDGECVNRAGRIGHIMAGTYGEAYVQAYTPIVNTVKQIWGSRDCHIISDTDNKQLFDLIPHAHKTYVTGEYAERLEAEVIKTLDRVL